jgi:hypothetical protein
MTTLQCLRILGPCTMTTLEERVTQSESIHADLALLLRRDMAFRISGPRFDLTPKGRKAFLAAEWARRQVKTFTAEPVPTRRSWLYGGGAG